VSGERSKKLFEVQRIRCANAPGGVPGLVHALDENEGFDRGPAVGRRMNCLSRHHHFDGSMFIVRHPAGVALGLLGAVTPTGGKYLPGRSIVQSDLEVRTLVIVHDAC